MKIVNLIFAMALVTLFACTDEYEEVIVPEQTQGIQVVNGMLRFSSSEELSKVMNSNEEITLDNYISNFVSQQDLFDEVIEAENENENVLAGLEGEALTKAAKHSKKYEECLREGIIRNVRYADGTSTYDINLCSPIYAKVVNREGFFAVRDTIVQVTKDYFKVWANGDIYNTDLLAQTESTDHEKGILVYDYTGKNQQMLNVGGHSRVVNFPAKPIPVTAGSYFDLVSNGDRYGIILYDLLGIADATHYKRDFYFRVFGHSKHTGGQFNYLSFSFQTTLNIKGITDGVGTNYPDLTLEARGMGKDVYYTIYPTWQLWIQGKDTQITDEPYIYYTYVWAIMTRAENYGPGGTTAFQMVRPNINGNFAVTLSADPQEGYCTVGILHEMPE